MSVTDSTSTSAGPISLCYDMIRNRRCGNGGVKLFPFARWLLLQLWRAAGGEAADATRVRFFVTRIAKKEIVQTVPVATIHKSDTPVPVARPDMRVRRERLMDHPEAPLLVTALGFNQSGRLVRVAGVSSRKQLFEQSFQQMFRCL
mmetsp:Transcript_16716/g.31364  ORF Transcript_16716/g.31364 Transcript_16716/m.31364 type:complete len:146 (-) Transcript_16716:182-619(-)